MPKAIFKKDGLTDTWGRENRKIEDKPCATCGKIFRPINSKIMTCSRGCGYKYRRNPNESRLVNECWWVDNKGYVQGFIRIDGRKVRIKQHRYIMQTHLGRPLAKDEDVHHINGNKQDNRIENLQLINHAEHSIYHNITREYKRGYQLILTAEERRRRSDSMRKMRTAKNN